MRHIWAKTVLGTYLVRSLRPLTPAAGRGILAMWRVLGPRRSWAPTWYAL